MGVSNTEVEGEVIHLKGVKGGVYWVCRRLGGGWGRGGEEHQQQEEREEVWERGGDRGGHCPASLGKIVRKQNK